MSLGTVTPFPERCSTARPGPLPAGRPLPGLVAPSPPIVTQSNHLHHGLSAIRRHVRNMRHVPCRRRPGRTHGGFHRRIRGTSERMTTVAGQRPTPLADALTAALAADDST